MKAIKIVENMCILSQSKIGKEELIANREVFSLLFYCCCDVIKHIFRAAVHNEMLFPMYIFDSMIIEFNFGRVELAYVVSPNEKLKFYL